jgi:hypothetical protein
MPESRSDWEGIGFPPCGVLNQFGRRSPPLKRKSPWRKRWESQWSAAGQTSRRRGARDRSRCEGNGRVPWRAGFEVAAPSKDRLPAFSDELDCFVNLGEVCLRDPVRPR